MNLEAGERIAAKPWFLLLFNVAFGGIWAVFGLDAGNLFISILTANLVLVGLSGARRSQLAIHAKLDCLIIATDKASDDLTHVEEEAEETIQERRL